MLLFRSIGAYAGITIARSALTLITLPLLTHTLPPHEYGIIVLLTPVWWIGQSLLSLGASEGIARSVQGRQGSDIAEATPWLLVVIALATLGVVAVASQFSRLLVGIPFGREVSTVLLIAGLQSMTATLSAMLRGQLRVRAATWMIASANVGAVVIGTATAMVTKDANGYFSGVAVALALTTVLGVTYQGGAAISLTRSGMTLAFDAVRLGVPAVPQVVALLALDAGLRRVVLDAHGSAELATYGVAAATGGLLWAAVKSASLAWGPLVYSYEEQDMATRVGHEVRLLLLLVGLAAGLGIASSTLVVGILMPSTYPSKDFVGMVAGVALSGITGLTYVSVQQLCYRYRLTRLLPIAIAPTVVVILLGAWFGRGQLSLMALSAAPALTLFLGFVTTSYLLSRHRPVALPFKPMVAWSLLCMVLVGVVQAVHTDGAAQAGGALLAALAAVGYMVTRSTHEGAA